MSGEGINLLCRGAILRRVISCFTLLPVPLGISVSTRNEVVRRISGKRSLELLKTREADNPPLDISEVVFAFVDHMLTDPE